MSESLSSFFLFGPRKAIANIDSLVIKLTMYTCRIPSLHQAALYAFSATTHVFQFLGRARSNPHSSAEAEVISCDAGVKMKEIPAFILWDCVLDVLPPHSIHSVLAPGNRSQDILSNHSTNNHWPATLYSDSLVETVVDHVLSSISPMPSHAHLFLFEGNATVIKDGHKKDVAQLLSHVARRHSCQL